MQSERIKANIKKTKKLMKEEEEVERELIEDLRRIVELLISKNTIAQLKIKTGYNISRYRPVISRNKIVIYDED